MAAQLGSLAAQWLLGSHVTGVQTDTADYLKGVKVAPVSPNDDDDDDTELLQEIERLHCTHRQAIFHNISVTEVSKGQIPLGPVPRNFLVTSLTSS